MMTFGCPKPMMQSASLAFALLCLPAVAQAGTALAQDAQAKAAQSEGPDVSYMVMRPQPRAIVHELPGRIAPKRIAAVRPRISGILTERLFHQGSDVQAGDPLYKIDREPFEIELQAAEAALEKAEATLELARQTETRVARLASQQIAARAENERAIAGMREAKADVAARKADVARAKLNLAYTTIRAPISGRIGAAIITEGSLVIQNDTANLATIQQLDPIYADFTQSVSELRKLRKALASGDLERVAPDAVKVRLKLDDETTYPASGKLLFSDARVEADTGQVTLRGEFPNPNRELLPGMYVRVLIEQGVDTDSMAVPPQAVQRDAGGGSAVYVVKADNRAALQPVRLGSVQGGLWLVLEGLKEGDHVIVDGFQKFAPGNKVKPHLSAEWRDKPQAAADAASALK